MTNVDIQEDFQEDMEAREDLSSITQSLGFCLDAEGKVCLPLTEAYEQACDTAFMRVSTGAQDFQSAVREATGDPELPQIQSRYQVLSQEYSRFSKAAGLRTQVERAQVAAAGIKSHKLHEKTYTGGIGSPKTDLDYIASEEYKSKFSSISNNSKLNRSIYERCKAAVTHQSGKFTEDLSIIDLQGNLIGATSSKVAYETQYSQSLKSLVLSAEPYSLVSIHDHGTNVPPSGADFASAGSKKYAFGIVSCHDGKVYWYSSANARPFLPSLIDDKVDKYRTPPYNKSIQEAFEQALNDAVEVYGIEWRELK